jgi:zinc protease
MLPSHARVAICLVALAAANSPAAAQPGPTKVGTVEGVTEYKLGNGLRVLLIPDGSQPKVTVNCTILVGSRHEGYGETGMAHLLEHMAFKGCPKFPDVPKALRDHGASFNGTTWLDRTNYFETMPAGDENLEFGIELEADRLANSFIRREDLLSEFSVVRSEFEAGENDPERILSQRMLAAAFEWHNYGKSTIGNRSDIERVPIDNLQAFYRKYYRPDNALVIVAGKFDEGKALALVAKHFGPLKNPAAPIRDTYTEEPPQDGERVVSLRRVGTVGAVGAVYHIPAGSHPDFAAVEVLEQVLGMEFSGRLYKALVDAKKASRVSVAAYPLHDPGTLEVTATTAPEKVEAARDALTAVLEHIDQTPVTDEEVARARRKLLQFRERTLANSQSFSIQLSEWAACGSWKLFFLHRDRVEKVTAADVNRVAKAYLVRSNRTVGVYVPTTAPERAAVPAAPDVAKLVAGYTGRTALAAGEAFDPTPENVEKRVIRGTVGEGVRYALLSKKTRGETVTLSLTLRFGNPESLTHQAAVADLLGPMLLRGTKDKSRQEIRDEFDRLNAQVSIRSGAGRLAVSVQTKRANLPAVLKLLGEVLRDPAFPASEFEVLRRESLEELEKGRTDPRHLAMIAVERKLNPYPPDDARYVPTVDESIERLKGVTVERVRTFYARQLGGTAGELAIVGDFDPAAAVERIDGFLKGWSAAVPYKRIEKPARIGPAYRDRIRTPDKANAVYVAGVAMPLSDADPEYPAVVVGNYALGQTPASRLWNRVRGLEGLSYGIGSNVFAYPLDKGGYFYVFAITNPRNVNKVDASVAEELAKFLADGLSAAELEEAKKAYLQSQRETRANDRTLATQLSGALHAGRTFAYYAELEKQIEALQPADVKRAFDKVLDAKRMIVVQAGDFPPDGEKK